MKLTKIAIRIIFIIYIQIDMIIKISPVNYNFYTKDNENTFIAG